MCVCKKPKKYVIIKKKTDKNLPKYSWCVNVNKKTTTKNESKWNENLIINYTYLTIKQNNIHTQQHSSNSVQMKINRYRENYTPKITTNATTTIQNTDSPIINSYERSQSYYIFVNWYKLFAKNYIYYIN